MLPQVSVEFSNKIKNDVRKGDQADIAYPDIK